MRCLIVLSLAALALAQTTEKLWPTVQPSVFDCTGKTEGHMYPDSTDCSTYYICDGNIANAYQYTCDPNTVFYEPGQNCDWEFNVPPPCGSSSNGIIWTPAATGNPITQEPDPFFCDSLPQGTYPDPDCCTKYYVCDGGWDVGQAVTPQYCPGELVYNPSVGYCDWPANVPGCQDGHCN